jgi:two-component system, OmpR family, heavy metal sensor histidine kinase CusS
VPTTSIRSRLTFWYLGCVCVVLAVFGFGARAALRNSIQAAIDHDLDVRLNDVHDFVIWQTKISRARLVHELQEQAQTGLGGGLVELWSDSGSLLFRAEGLSERQLGSETEPYLSEGTTRFSTVGPKDAHARAAVRSFNANGGRYTARVIEPIHQFEESQKRFDVLLLLGAPLLVMLSALGGFLISGRALAPVDRLTKDADSIGAASLSRRLELPAADDEIRRLAVTLNRMLGRLDSAFERLIQFTADASHELRAPLTLVQTAADYSLRVPRTAAEMNDAFRKIQCASEQMTRLLDDLLLLARGDTGAAEAGSSTVELSQVASIALDSIRVAAESKRQALGVSLPDEEVRVRGDEHALNRLLFILLDNAVKYTEAKGSVELSVRRSGAMAEISVADTGIGIRAEDLPRIWDRFWRADIVRSRSEGGSGLGLSIARAIAGRHGAVLEAESELGRGSRFTLRMPALD